MNALPLVERELRVAARRRGTHRARRVAVGLGAALWLWLLWFSALGLGSPQLGHGGFVVLAWLLLGAALLDGARRTADALSQERREGTLELLWLTRLNGGDVVLGKLVAAATGTANCLLAGLPALALCLTLGGVTSGEFWRVTFAIGGLTLVALSAGLLVSSASVDARRALGGTLGLLATLLLMPVGLAKWLSAAGSHWLAAPLATISPLTAFLTAFAGDYQGAGVPVYWASLGVGLLWSGSFLLLASGQIKTSQFESQPGGRPHLLARLSDEGGLQRRQPASRGEPLRALRSWLRSAAARRPPPALKEANPAAWLAARSLGRSWPLWLGLAALAVVWFGLWQAGRTAGPGAAWLVSSGFAVSVLISWAAKIVVAAGAAHALAEPRRSGALELLLCTPVTSQMIVSGHWRAARRAWLGPALAALALKLAIVVAVLAESWSSPLVTVFVGSVWSAWETLSFLGDLAAVFWVASWLGLRSGRATMAAVQALLLCQVLPSVLLLGMTAVSDVVFIIWAHDELRRKFRQRVQMPLGNPG